MALRQTEILHKPLRTFRIRLHDNNRSRLRCQCANETFSESDPYVWNRQITDKKIKNVLDAPSFYRHGLPEFRRSFKIETHSMIRLLLVALLFMPPASLPAIAAPVGEVIQNAHHSALTTDSSTSTSEAPEESENGTTFTPMQEEIIGDHDSGFSPFLATLWEKHVALPTSPLFPVTLVDLFRPPKRA